MKDKLYRIHILPNPIQILKLNLSYNFCTKFFSLQGNSVHVFVYALGDEFKHTNTPKYFLVQLADQNNMAINNSFGPQWQLRWPVCL